MALDIVSSFRAALFRKKESKPDGVFLLIIKFSFIRFVTTLSIKTLSAFEACVSGRFFLLRKISMALKTRGLKVDNTESRLSFSLLVISVIML